MPCFELKNGSAEYLTDANKALNVSKSNKVHLMILKKIAKVFQFFYCEWLFKVGVKESWWFCEWMADVGDGRM
jgi:hypothetical protein